MREAGGRLISLWGAEEAPGTFAISAAYALEDGILWLQLPVGDGHGDSDGYPDISAIFPCATRMQRAVYDLLGLRAIGAEDTRPWLNHGNWPADYFPLQKLSSGTERFQSQEADYPFVHVDGDGVHEIAVGPIHAGVIEPGHFRFSVVGEKVLRLEERLGYAHRGIERLFEHVPALDGHRLAGRIAGDTTVAFTWAYCMAVERALNGRIPPRAQWLRALLLERERIANHLGDLGALGNDAGFAYGLAQFSRLKEDWLRLNDRAFGHRYLMDRIVPGGVATDIDARFITAMLTQCDQIDAQVRVMQTHLRRSVGAAGSLCRCGHPLRQEWRSTSACAGWSGVQAAGKSMCASITLTRPTTRFRCRWSATTGAMWQPASRSASTRSTNPSG